MPGMNPVAMTCIIVLLSAAFAWSAQRRWFLLRIGTPEPRMQITSLDDVLARLKDVAIFAGIQKRMPSNDRYRIAGIAHLMIFGGFNVLILRTLILWGRGYDESFDMFGLLAHDTFVGKAYEFAKDTVALGVVAGALVFVYYRVIRKQSRMTLSLEGLMILGIIITMMLADMLYDGASIVLHARATHEAVHFSPLQPAGSLFAVGLQGLSQTPLDVLRHAGFWWHSSFVLIFANLLPYSKHFHVITAAPNVFFRNRGPAGALPMVEDLEGKVEREEPVGLAKVTGLSWKHILDLYTCTECGRCSDNCPAYTTGKKLSPKHLTLALRDNLYASDGALTRGESRKAFDEETDKHVLHTHPPAPEDGYFTVNQAVDIVPNILHPDVIWACTSCRACEEQCPVMISYVDKIVDMRRDQVLIKGEFPPELQKPFKGMETNGNPWNLPAMDRADWSSGLDIPFIADKPDAAVLYWVGCAASYDDRAKRIARAVARLLDHAEVDFAVLGSEETCTGDPARRAGNEFLFQMLAQQNVETLNNYGVDKKTIITACPHCFNTLLNEYPQFGGRYDVVHHTDFLNGLIARKKLVPSKSVEAKVVYHDSCYLGRYNAVYDSPREVLRAIPGVTLEEVPYWNRSKGLCCGAGGAQMFMEEQHGTERVNKKRTLQLLDTGATKIASGCPFCMTMLTDGLKAMDKENDIEQLDIAEMLERSVDFDAPHVAHAAE